ncbi:MULTISPECIES: hypothetical protein [Actinomadura]|uniref:hypothetical protein n=1 Tax=Actinomadura TaxID=1988 RepID=UPI001BE4CDA9|nr:MULTISPECIES: hypothetical protein [Actinomadura]MBT2206552.1 hypothetical protein [Actinomadura sp. NEAU-AAG7]
MKAIRRRREQELLRLRREFPHWEITQAAKGAWRAVREPARRYVLGSADDVRREIMAVDYCFHLGLLQDERNRGVK